MVTQVTTVGRNGMGGRTSLEELVDRLMDALFTEEPETEQQSVARTVHDARRLRRSGDLDGALAVFDNASIAHARDNEIRWMYGEWLGLAKRTFRDRGAVLYSQGRGRAAVLVPKDDGRLEVVAVLGLRWRPSKVVSRRSLRGLRALSGGG